MTRQCAQATNSVTYGFASGLLTTTRSKASLPQLHIRPSSFPLTACFTK